MSKPARSPAVAHLIDSNATLWHNVEALMTRRFGCVNLKGFAKHCGIGLATVQRIQAKQTSVGLAILDKIADAHGIASWQLLVPGLDMDNPPALQPVTARERDLYDKIMQAAKVIASEPEVQKYL